MKKIFLFTCVTFLLLGAAAFAGGQKEAASAEGKVVTLKVNYEGTEIWPKIFDEFAAANPNIKVEPNIADIQIFESGQLKLSLRSGSGPDVMQVDASPARMGLLAKAGLILSLDDAYKKFGWEFQDWTLKGVTYNGKKFGTPMTIDFIGVMYNKNLYKKMGLSEPAIYADFLSMLKKMKADGYVPMTWGTRKCCAHGHYYSQFIEAAAGREAVEDLLYGDGKWTHPGFVKAAEECIMIVKEGYTNRDPNAFTDAEARAKLWTLEAVQTITGNWRLGTIIKEGHDFDPGWYALPPITKASKGGFTGGLGSGWAVSAKTANPDAAITLLNFMFFEEPGQRIQLEDGDMPTYKVLPGLIEKASMHKIHKDGVQYAQDARGIGYNLSVYVPANTKNTYYEVIQGWAGGMLTAQKGTEMIQKAWEKDIADGLVQK